MEKESTFSRMGQDMKVIGIREREKDGELTSMRMGANTLDGTRQE